MSISVEWRPQLEPLKQLIQCLDSSLSSRDHNAQKNAEIMLKQAKSSPDIDNYLCFLLTSGTVSSDDQSKPESLHTARSAAGIMLKNDIKTHYGTIPEQSKLYVKATIIGGLQDPNAQIRNFAGTVITELLKQGGVMSWPEILPRLTSMIGNESGQESNESQEGAMAALLKVCEDNKNALDKFYRSERPLDVLIPRLIDFTSSPLAKVRANAIASLYVFMDYEADSFMQNVDLFLNRLFALATEDGSEEVKKRICRSIVRICEISPTKIFPHMEGLVSYMIAQQRNVDDPELALEAAEFWLTVGEDKNLRSALGPYLSSVIPVLLDSMVYSQDDILRLEAEAEEDDSVDDREQDIRPQFAASKVARSAASGADGANGVTPQKEADNLSDGEIEDYDDDDDAEDDPEEQWNLRKCSAAALDVLASVFREPVFETTIPYLKNNLNHLEWPYREAAVLATGAIAEGCMEVMEPHLPDLTPFLISLLEDKEPVVRKITCWSLGRYSGWASHLDAAGKEQFFVPMMDGILKRMLDKNKRVQEAAASAFATLEEKSNKELENPKYCEVIVRQFAECFVRYKDRNMFILYDCVQTLAEHVGAVLQKPELVQSLMPALVGRWEKVADKSQEMFPLLECLSYVATALGIAFAPYAPPIFNRGVKIIYQNLQDTLAATEDSALESPEKDFLVTSLDLLSSIIQALGDQQSKDLLASSRLSMFDLLPLCLEDSSSDVRQSAYALLGDCAIFVFAELRPSLERIMPILIAQLNLANAENDAVATGYAVTSNACWSCGEISMRAENFLAPYMEVLMQRLYAILSSNSVPSTLHENAAIALGRLGGACPDLLSPHISTVAPLFLRSMSTIPWTDEKAHAMGGMARAVISNPQGLQQCLLEFLTEISTAPAWINSSYGNGQAGSFGVFQKVLDLYKQHIPDFDSFLHHLTPSNEESLRHTYNI